MTHRNLDRLDTLDPAFRAAVLGVLDRCAARGVHMQVLFGARAPTEQAKLWRRSRSRAQVDAAVARLRSDGAPYLARVLVGVGPQATGPWATDALPGQSWHQYGLAVDAAWLVGGRVSWDTGEGSGYRVWREEGLRAGLHTGPPSDWVHLQARAGSPRLAWPELDRAMQERWGDPKKWPAGAT